MYVNKLKFQSIGLSAEIETIVASTEEGHILSRSCLGYRRGTWYTMQIEMGFINLKIKFSPPLAPNYVQTFLNLCFWCRETKKNAEAKTA